MALAALPLLRRIVQDVESPESLRVCVLQVFPLPLEQNVRFSKVAKDECDLRLVPGILENGSGRLPHWGDAGASRNQGDVLARYWNAKSANVSHID